MLSPHSFHYPRSFSTCKTALLLQNSCVSSKLQYVASPNKQPYTLTMRQRWSEHNRGEGRGQPHFLSKRRDWLLRTRATCTCTRITQAVTSSVLKPPPRALSFPQHCQTRQQQCNISISQRKSAHNLSESNFLLNCVPSLWRTMPCPMSPGLSSSSFSC